MSWEFGSVPEIARYACRSLLSFRSTYKLHKPHG
jgi:hypothetical protein